jgi:hypothetical protein
MADKKISQLTSATTPLAGSESLPIVQAGSTVKVTAENLTAGRNVPGLRFGANVTPSTVFDAAGGAGSNLNCRFSPSGWTIRHRFGVQYSGDTSVLSNNALMSSGTAGDLDDTANTGSALIFSASGVLEYVVATAGANPRTFAKRFSLNSAGDVSADVGDVVLGAAGKGLKFAGNSNVIWRVGAGTPEGAVTAPIGSLFTRTDGGASTTLYVKESGAGNTGWVAK